MSGPIDLTELTKLPHIDAAALQGRSLLLMPVWDGATWSMWIDAPEGCLTKIRVVDTARSSYLATAPAGDYDLHIPFVDFMWQRASWPEVTRLISGICDDFHLMATIAAKLEHFHETRASIDPTLIPSFVKSELEQLIIVARSIFDLLQETIAHFWNERVTLKDPAAEAIRRRHRMPPTFAKIAFNSDSPRPATEIAARYALPSAASATYEKHAPFFLSLRASRDGIIHGGSSVDMIFATDRGFCVDPRSKHYHGFPWKPEHYFNANIVSLRPWVANVVLRTIEACSEIMFALAAELRFPDRIAPAHHVFIRDPSNPALVRLLQVQQGHLVWWGRNTTKRKSNPHRTSRQPDRPKPTRRCRRLLPRPQHLTTRYRLPRPITQSIDCPAANPPRTSLYEMSGRAT
jgi:hypothetical protein